MYSILLSISLLFTLLLTETEISAKNIPVYRLVPYIKGTCSRRDPNLNKCVVENGAPAIKFVAKGDPKYNIPPIDPLVIDVFKIKQGTKQVGIDLQLTNSKLIGISNSKFVKADMNFGQTSRWDFAVDKLKMVGKYNISGKVLLFPISGEGDAELNFENVTLQYYFTETVEKKSNGYHYVKLINGRFHFETEKMTVKFDNLFNGDRLLGDNMNRFVNENWKQILADLVPGIEKVLVTLIDSTLNNMATLIPDEFMYPDDYKDSKEKTNT